MERISCTTSSRPQQWEPNFCSYLMKAYRTNPDKDWMAHVRNAYGLYVQVPSLAQNKHGVLGLNRECDGQTKIAVRHVGW